MKPPDERPDTVVWLASTFSFGSATAAWAAAPASSSAAAAARINLRLCIGMCIGLSCRS